MIGSTLGSYRIVEKIGAGGMGEVYRALDTMLERDVAIKALHRFVTQDAGRLERFRSEAITLARLSHPNIAILHTFFEINSDYYMVMEYVTGESFDSLLRREGRLPLRVALEWFCQGLKGFEHAHARGVIHRDIKPGNLMLNAEGVVKITDFGIARVVGGQRLTQTGKLIGTLEYMSPEQVKGEEQDARSDIYSLGILLHEMTTGQVPFSSTSDYEVMRSHLEVAPKPARELNPNLPVEVEAAISKALAKNPAERFQSAGEFRALLEPVAARLPASDFLYTAPQGTREWNESQAPVANISAAALNPTAPATASAVGTTAAAPSTPGGSTPDETPLIPTPIPQTAASGLEYSRAENVGASATREPSRKEARTLTLPGVSMPSWLSPKTALIGALTFLFAMVCVAAVSRRAPSETEYSPDGKAQTTIAEQQPDEKIEAKDELEKVPVVTAPPDQPRATITPIPTPRKAPVAQAPVRKTPVAKAKTVESRPRTIERAAPRRVRRRRTVRVPEPRRAPVRRRTRRASSASSSPRRRSRTRSTSRPRSAPRKRSVVDIIKNS